MYEFPCLENPSWRVIKSIRVLQEAEVMMEESDFFFFFLFSKDGGTAERFTGEFQHRGH